MIDVIFSKEKPPVYDECVRRFGVNWKRGVIFTYGNTIHCRYKISVQKIAHEIIHIEQQNEMGVNQWWQKYFDDVEFRLSQELEAYQNEVEWVNSNIHNPKLKQKTLNEIVFDLSGPMYGNIISADEAKRLLNI